jgi:hypothetical protein
MDLLGDVGGMYESILFLGYLLVSFLSHRLFMSAIMKQLYQVKADQLGTCKDFDPKKMI